MNPSPILRFLLALAAALIGARVAHLLAGGGTPGSALARSFQPVLGLVCGLATLERARSDPDQRLPWALLGGAIVLYAAGSGLFGLAFADDAALGLEISADVLRLALYPLAFVAVGLLAARHLTGLGGTVWLDGMIAGAVLAALAAAVLFEPVLGATVAQGPASVARLGFPIGDLLPVGFVVVIWSLGTRRLDAQWALLGAGFLLCAVADGAYLIQAAEDRWAAGGPLDLLYAAAMFLLAGAAAVAPREDPGPRERIAAGLLVPVGLGLTAVALTGYGLFDELNPVAVALTFITLLALVLRFGLTLARLTRRGVELAALATTDALTGVANHRALHERLAEELDRARREGASLAIVALDVDHFKAINDTYGHVAGDALLQSIATAVAAECRPYDVVGRVGGEEFALLLPGVDGEEAFRIADRCLAAVSRLSVGGASVTCSAGVAAHPADDPDGRRLLELADGALYWAKRSGRARVRRYDERTVVLLSSAEQHEQVLEVLANPDALTPVFQPIVELATGRIGGYEALTRFEHAVPVRAPDQWFAQARRSGLGPALEACAITASLAVEGRPPGTFLSLNVSPAALLSAEVGRALPEDLSDIVIELTEDELFTTDEGFDLALASLRACGARIAVDDAGAGYAGLQQVIRIKPEILKLDRSLIRGLHADASRLALVEALSRFAVTTGAAVCGEGVEAVDELRALARLDVTYAQGFVLGRPGEGWPAIDADVAAEAASPERWGMRLAAPAVLGDGPATLGDLTDALARVRSPAELDAAIALVERHAHADEVVVSVVRHAERCVQTLNHHARSPRGERFAYDDYPTTERVVVDQVLGQVLAGDPAADPAELEHLARAEAGGVLLAPIMLRAETVGLLEFYRDTVRPWTAMEIDEARMIALHLGSTVQLLDAGLPPVAALLTSER